MKILIILFVLLFAIAFGQPPTFDIPVKPEYDLPQGYSWQLQQDEAGELVWVAMQVGTPPESQHIPRPQEVPPAGMAWHPVTSNGIIVQWIIRDAPTWFDRNRPMVEFLAGFILALLNIFSFQAGRKKGSPA